MTILLVYFYCTSIQESPQFILRKGYNEVIVIVPNLFISIKEPRRINYIQWNLKL